MGKWIDNGIKVYEPKEADWLVFKLNCGVKIISRKDGVWLESLTTERRYYLLQDPKGSKPLAICTLKKGEKILDHTFYHIKWITKSEYETYKEFDLFPVLEHYDESSGQQSSEIPE